MRTKHFGILLAVFGVLALFGNGCEPYHHGRVGMEIDIHSKDHHDDGDDHHDHDHHDHHDDDH